MDAREKAIRQRLKNDFPHYAEKCLQIRTKSGAIEPLLLNRPQLYLHERIEAQRARAGHVRQLVLKGRQQGCSTYVEGRYFWQVTHRFGMRAFILAHDQEGTDNIFGIAERYYEHCPALVRPQIDASNARELVFGKLDSGYRVATAGSKGAGRSQTVQYFHGSEVAYWPHAEAHLAGALQTVPPGMGEVILESTSAGPQGVFYELCEKALAGRGEYELTFIPWFWSPEYRTAPPADFLPSAEEEAYAAAHGLDVAQLAWRRAKIEELNGIGVFRAEYPATVEEAFKADAAGALWRREEIDKYRVQQAPELARIVVAIDPQATKGAKAAETGIIGAGLGKDGIGYALEDASIDGQPPEWAQAALDVYDRLKADELVAERNNGGDMVKFTIQALRPRLEVTLVWASRGKEVRAGPVAAKARAGQIRHVGYLPALEDELCTWVPGVSPWSPNRLDACFVAGTLIETKQGPRPIEEIKVGDSVLTRNGYRKVLHAGMTNKRAKTLLLTLSSGMILHGTENHPVYTTERGFIELCSLKKCDTVLTLPKIGQYSTALNMSGSKETLTSSLLTAPSDLQPMENCTEKYGWQRTARYLRRILSTIWTATHSIMNLITCNASLSKSMRMHTVESTRINSGNISIAFGTWRLNGTHHRKGSPGTVNTVKKYGRTGKLFCGLVSIVKGNIKVNPAKATLDFVHDVVSHASMSNRNDIMNKEDASSVEKSLQLKKARHNSFVPVSVDGLSEGTSEAVYNLEVEDMHEYFANGILVHNCVWAFTELFGLQEPEALPSGTRPLAVNLNRRFGGL